MDHQLKKIKEKSIQNAKRSAHLSNILSILMTLTDYKLDVSESKEEYLAHLEVCIEELEKLTRII